MLYRAYMQIYLCVTFIKKHIKYGDNHEIKFEILQKSVNNYIIL